MNALMRGLARSGLALAVVGSTFTAVDAAYIIRLNNGNEYVTTRYWEEGRQVLFDAYGGVFGVDKSFVSRVEQADRPLKLPPAADGGSFDRSEPASQSTGTTENSRKPDSKTKSPRKADDPLVLEFNRLKDRSKKVNGMLTSEIRELLDQITAYKNKLTGNSNLFVEYGREFNALREIGARVENVLRSRTQ